MRKKYTHIIWDFNGTLLDDVEAGIRSVNQMLEERGLKPISSKQEYRAVFKFPIIDYYRDIGFDFDREPYEVLAPIWVELYNINSKQASLREGALEALEYFASLGLGQILLSATERNMLLRQISELRIDGYFDKVLGLDNIHAYSKKDIALIWKSQNPDAIPLFIGDTEHDADVAKALGADCLLVEGGHQSRDTLLRCGCEVCADLYNAIKLL